MRSSTASISFALIAFVGLALAGPVRAQQSGGAGRVSTIACSQETTRISGAGQRVRLTGECRSVVVSGSGNRVVVERVGSLNVSGMDNEVRWERSLSGDAPHVVTSGIKNVVTRATPASDANASAGAASPQQPGSTSPAPVPAPAPSASTTSSTEPAKAGEPLVVKQSGQTLRLDCAARPVTVSGSTNTITLTGTCGQLSVSGTGNKIAVERTPRIVTTGHKNEITWQHGQGDQQPSLRNSGMSNIVRHVAP
jgi:hypothetical protein